MIDIDWSQMITAEMKAAAEGERLRQQLVIEQDAWRISELDVIRNQLDLLLFEDPEALPGTEAQWKLYGRAVSRWKEGAEGFPYIENRPVRPT